MKDNKNDMSNIGIRSDRIMTSEEVMNAAINRKSVENMKNTEFGLFGWLLIGFGMAIILIATIQTILG